MWPKTTLLLPVWPRDTKKLDTLKPTYDFWSRNSKHFVWILCWTNAKKGCLILWCSGPLVIGYQAQVLTHLLCKVSNYSQNHGINEQWAPHPFRPPIWPVLLMVSAEYETQLHLPREPNKDQLVVVAEWFRSLFILGSVPSIHHPLPLRNIFSVWLFA